MGEPALRGVQIIPSIVVVRLKVPGRLSMHGHGRRTDVTVICV